MELYCNLILGLDKSCTGYVGGCDGVPPGAPEPFLGYHAGFVEILTAAVIR